MTRFANGVRLPHLPQFRILANPIVSRANIPWMVSAGEAMYSPRLWPAYRYLSSPLEKWYLYYSTDHSTGQGGIGLLIAPHPRGPWTDLGRIYVDTVQGSQTETPSVEWDPVNARVNLYYQQKISTADQSTLLAYSADGFSSWTRHGKVISAPTPVRYPGNGHAGYANVFKVNKKWIAHSLMGGTTRCHFAVSYSDDGVNWTTDPRLISYQAQRTESRLGRRVSSYQTTPFFWRGSQLAAIVTTPHTSGGASGDKIIKLAQYRTVRDFTVLQDIVKPGDFSWASETTQMPHVVEDDGMLYMVFLGRNASNNGVIGLAEVAA